MRTSVSRPSEIGMTLVEVLVVLAVLGVVAAVATLGFSRLAGEDAAARGERLCAWLEGLEQRALLDGAPYRARLAGGRWEADYWWRGGWRPLPGEEQGPKLGAGTAAVRFLPDGRVEPEWIRVSLGEGRTLPIAFDGDGRCRAVAP
ncbi:MAG: hypothetical protein KatS3mg124_1436 [Porticoccaceae bacterium]|nr:MAG: hypothetical protein KatS3mg124_1436 [Porticoccaceae bacterium]